MSTTQPTRHEIDELRHFEAMERAMERGDEASELRHFEAMERAMERGDEAVMRRGFAGAAKIVGMWLLLWLLLG